MVTNPMEVERPDKREKRIIIEPNVTLLSRLIAILLAPAIVVGSVIRIFAKGYNTYPFSLDHVLGFSFIAGPFVFYISYKLWKALGTKVILTDQKIIEKTTSGKEQHLYWSVIKKISIIKNNKTNCIHFVFYRKKRVVPFDSDSPISCPPGAFSSTTNLSKEATSLILNKIDLYKIPIKGERGLLEELSKKYSQSMQKQARLAVPHTEIRKPIPAKPSSAQTPTPK